MSARLERKQQKESTKHHGGWNYETKIETNWSKLVEKKKNLKKFYFSKQNCCFEENSTYKIENSDAENVNPDPVLKFFVGQNTANYVNVS